MKWEICKETNTWQKVHNKSYPPMNKIKTAWDLVAVLPLIADVLQTLFSSWFIRVSKLGHMFNTVEMTLMSNWNVYSVKSIIWQPIKWAGLTGTRNVDGRAFNHSESKTVDFNVGIYLCV